MATYKIHNYSAPKNWRDYMPGYTSYSYKRPDDVYSDNKSAYAREISAAQNRLNNIEANKPKGYVSPYSENIKALINNMADRKFNYDVNADALYNQYKNKYVNQGKMAMQDTIGQAAAMTGGYGNSYAAAVGNQAYQSHLDKLNDRIPELYQLAMDRYNTEGADMQHLYSMMANQEAQEYGKYRDTVGDYQTDRGYYDAQLQNLRTMGQNLWGQNWDNYWNAADRTDTNRQNAINTALNLYGQDWDNYHWANEQTQHNYEQAVAEDQWGANFAENQRQYNETMAEKQRQFDATNVLNYYKASKSGSGSGRSSGRSSSSASSGSSSADASNYNAERVKEFSASISTPSELSRREMKATVNGKKQKIYDSYSDYVDDVIQKWLNDGRLSNSDAMYLMNKYDIV